MDNKTINDMVAEILAVGTIRRGMVREHLSHLTNPFDALNYLTRVETFIRLGLRDTGVVGIETGLEYFILQEQQKAIEAGRQKAERDPLTRLYNRSAIDDTLNGHGAYANRRVPRDKDAVMMLDIDQFGRINTDYGHVTGDAVIKAVARLVQENMRETFVGRYGGEEFFVHLVQTDKYGGKVAAERVRKAVEEKISEYVALDLERMGLPVPRELMRKGVTLSVGIADGQLGEKPYVLLDTADRALYLAKRCGRDSVVLDGHNPLNELSPQRKVFIFMGNILEGVGHSLVSASDPVKNLYRNK